MLLPIQRVFSYIGRRTCKGLGTSVVLRDVRHVLSMRLLVRMTTLKAWIYLYVLACICTYTHDDENATGGKGVVIGFAWWTTYIVPWFLSILLIMCLLGIESLKIVFILWDSPEYNFSRNSFWHARFHAVENRTNIKMHFLLLHSGLYLSIGVFARMLLFIIIHSIDGAQKLFFKCQYLDVWRRGLTALPA